MSNTDISINIGAIIKLFDWSMYNDNKNPVHREMYVWCKIIEAGGLTVDPVLFLDIYITVLLYNDLEHILE